MKRITSVFACGAAATVVLFCLNVFFGSVDIPAAGGCDVLLGRSSNEAWRFIVLESRLVQAVTAMLGGAALSAAGLMLQTCFANPLADTSILGVNAGASLGVAWRRPCVCNAACLGLCARACCRVCRFGCRAGNAFGLCSRIAQQSYVVDFRNYG